MPLLETALTAIGIAGAKFVAKKSIAMAADVMGLDVELSKELAGGAIDWFKDKVKDEAARKKLTQPFVEIPKTITNVLKPLFQEEEQLRKRDAKLPALNTQGIVEQLCLTLEDRVSLDFFLPGNLDAAKVTELLRDIRPLGQKTLLPADTQFYHRALERLVPELITLSSKLPAFPAEVAKTLLNRLDRVEGKVDGVQQHLDAQVEQAKTERSEFEARYRKAVVDKNDHLELFGADIAREAWKLPLSVAYVTLNLQSEGTADGSTMRSAEALFDELSPDAGRLLIRGEAGMGKSTLFRWAAIQASSGNKTDVLKRAGATLANQWASDWRHKNPQDDLTGRLQILHGRDFTPYVVANVWQLRVPFLIRLRDCPEGRLPSPSDFVKFIAKELGEPPKNWVLDVLMEGKALILLDGVDEVRGDFRESHLLADLTDLVKAYSECYFVVSTRPEAVPENWLSGLGFRESRINPLGMRDREVLIDRWHEAIAEGARSLGEEPDRFVTLAQVLKGKLHENPRLSLLASNPLLCAMICALHERDDEHLPEQESALCERLSLMLLHERDDRRNVHQEATPEWYRKLSYDNKKLIVRSIAYHMVVTRQQSVIDRGDAIEKVAERLSRMNQRIPEEVTPQQVLDTLMLRSGMLREATPPSGNKLGTLDFIHNAFKEYLAAERLVEENADGQLASQAHQKDWIPIILFAAATKREGFATKMLLKILGDDYQPEQKLGRTRKPKGERRKNLTEGELQSQQRLLLALRCLPVALDLAPELRHWLEQQLGRMFPPRSMVEAEALATAGDLAVPFLKHRSGVTKMARSVRALRLIGTEAARAVLRSYRDETSLEVLDELSQAMNPLEIPAVQQMVQEQWEADTNAKQSSIRKQVVDLSPLSGLRELSRLDISSTQVSDMSPLAGLSGLTTLDLWHTPVSDLSPLAELSALTSLDLGVTLVSDLSPLAGLSGLTRLNLINTQVNDLSPLADLSGLTTLDLNDTQVSDLSPLAGLSELTTLDLRNTPVSDLSPLAGLTKLAVVYVTDREMLKIPESLRGVVQD